MEKTAYDKAVEAMAQIPLSDAMDIIWHEILKTMTGAQKVALFSIYDWLRQRNYL